MPSEGVRRNATTYNAALTSLGRQRRLRDMEMLRREMRRCGIEANETFSVLITAHGDAKDALSGPVRCWMRSVATRRGVCKSAVVFNSSARSVCRAGDERLAKRVLERMRGGGDLPDARDAQHLAHGCQRRARLGALRMCSGTSSVAGNPPDAITLDCMCGIEKLPSRR